MGPRSAAADRAFQRDFNQFALKILKVAEQKIAKLELTRMGKAHTPATEWVAMTAQLNQRIIFLCV